eukprot:573019-Karenia_brevis.AAC.1
MKFGVHARYHFFKLICGPPGVPALPPTSSKLVPVGDLPPELSSSASSGDPPAPPGPTPGPPPLAVAPNPTNNLQHSKSPGGTSYLHCRMHCFA